MGHGNAARAFDRWGPTLDPRPLAVLARMALSTLDGDAAPIYWAGWEHLATSGGHPRPACGRCRGCKACRAPRRSVDRAVEALLEARVITRERRASRGRNAEYRLWLDGPAPVDHGAVDPLPGLDGDP